MKRTLVVCVMLFTFLPVLLVAQDVASLTGVVTDRTGAVVPDATVALLDTKTNESHQTKTNSLGVYSFYQIPPGPGYKVTFSKDGFSSLTVSDIYLGVGVAHTQNGQLQVGQRAETVEVNGEGASVTLNTSDNTVGNNFDMELVHELPILVRDNPTSLLLYEPGVVVASPSDDPSGNRVGSVTGARADQGSYSLDGLDINDYAIGQPFATVGQAPVDSIQEIRGETANPLSSEGRGSGAQLQLVTKSGTNRWHGSAYEYHRDTATEANSWFNNLNGIPRPALIRNQFGASLGGPILKNKLFFFFNYEGRRDASQTPVEWTVPLDSYRSGLLSYINSGPGCTASSRQDTQPGCITSWSSSQVQSTIGAQNGITFPGINTALQNFILSRYPRANDVANFGDGVNTGGFLTNIRTPQSPNLYVGRIDYNLSSSQKIFGRFTIRREVDGDNVNYLAPAVFPGDPLTHALENKDYAYVIGHTWTITNNMVNQFIYGETRQIFATPSLYNPLGLTDYNSPGGTSLFGNISAPYLTQSGQFRHIPVPEFKDDFTYVRGGHTFQVGATFKPISVLSSLGNSYNYSQLGLGGAFLPSLDANARPADILSDPNGVANLIWDQSLSFYIGRYADVSTNYNYTSQLQAQAIGTPSVRHYRANETEIYLQDSWKARNDLTLSYGLRYIYYSVPYETNGLEAISNTDFAGYIAPRTQAGLTGTGACYFALPGVPAPLGVPQCGATMPVGDPVTSFTLGGKANHAPGYYHPDWHDFAPRFGFAYNPSFTDGFMHTLFGDRKTVVRGGAGIVYDHAAVNSIQFVQNQVAAVFVNGQAVNYPLGDAGSSAAAKLANGPFFGSIGGVPPGLPSAPAVSLPYTPFVSPVGNGVTSANGGQLNDAFDPNFRTPYSETISFGIQRELPDHFQLDVNFFGRFGRRLMAAADAGELRDFRDPTSGQLMSQAFIGLAQDLRAGNAPAEQPFFDNLVTDPFGLTGTQLIAAALTPQATRSDMGSTVYALESAGFLPFGVGFNPQYVYDIFYTNKSASNYDGLLTTLHRKFAQGLQFDLNYTYSHSIDNLSAVANNVFGEAADFSGGVLCDPVNLRVCRGNSDFDLRHQISADGLYNLPFGRGKFFVRDAPGWLDHVIGGWQMAGDLTWRTGLAFTTVANAFPFSFNENVPALFNGDNSALNVHVHKDASTGRIQLFSNPTAAIGAFSEPLGFEAGSRNNLRGPRYSNVDLSLNKHIPIHERLLMEFRAEAFNLFNHPSFGLPGGNGGFVSTADVSDPAQFGVITQTASTARVMQFALRLDF